MLNPAIDERDETSAARTAATTKPSMTRRRVLRLVGGVGGMVTVAAIGGGAVRAVDQGVFATGEGPAYAAWQEAGNGGPVNLVHAAVLASNAHNSQPWLFRVQATDIDLFADKTRGTGANDPLGRELMISLGCALENLMLAAGPNGFAAKSTLFPNPADQNHVARINLTASEPTTSTLFDAIPLRHTNRAAFSGALVAPDTLGSLSGLNDDADVGVVWLTSPAEMQAFTELTIRATEAFIADTEQSVDGFKWWRGDWDELQRRKDGLTLDAAGLSPLTRVIGKLMPDISRAQSDAAWLKGTREPQLSTAAAFGVIVTRDHRAAAQRLAAGRLFQRLHLWATVEGLAMQPLNQTVERRDRELSTGIAPVIGRSLAALLPDPGWQAVMPFRIGYPADQPPKSPRRPATEVVLA